MISQRLGVDVLEQRGVGQGSVIVGLPTDRPQLLALGRRLALCRLEHADRCRAARIEHDIRAGAVHRQRRLADVDVRWFDVARRLRQVGDEDLHIFVRRPCARDEPSGHRPVEIAVG